MEEKKLDIYEAYAAMFIYLNKLYSMTHSDDLAGFLGSMSFLPDGKPIDPAVWHDWLDSVEEAYGKFPETANIKP